MKKIKRVLSLFMTLLLTNNLFSQDKNEVHFFGFRLSTYDMPVLVGVNEYKAYFKYSEDRRSQGRLIIDEKAKTFTIKWLSGEDWIAKFSKKQIKDGREDLYGDVTKIIYEGKWVDDGNECSLILIKTNSSGCITILNSVKVVDKYYGINTWKKIFMLGTSTCLYEDYGSSRYEKEQQIKAAETKEKERENKIKSKIYDLEEYAPEAYKSTLNKQREAIVKYFTSSSNISSEFPSYNTLASSEKKYARFKNTYNVNYKLINKSRESVSNDYVVVAGLRDIRTLKQIKLVDGNDSKLKLFNSASISIPTIEIEGYEVMTEANLKDVRVDFTRGLTEVKVKDNKVEFKKFLPEQDFHKILIDELKKKEANGKYLVKYEIQDIMGDKSVNVELEKKSKKVNSSWLLSGLLVGLLFL
ncbi:hypothetical protein [Pseudopedobacter beijingensis]|uniref:DUF4468 domain-containing protein n=1 Tax=Pseudopedobacter beijingensis TaxID=1207056 RepID=A0ABW4IDH9_9SPHI